MHQQGCSAARSPSATHRSHQSSPGRTPAGPYFYGTQRMLDSLGAAPSVRALKGFCHLRFCPSAMAHLVAEEAEEFPECFQGATFPEALGKSCWDMTSPSICCLCPT